MKKINSLIACLCLIALSSCDNFLDIQPVGKVIPVTAKDYRELLTQAYSSVPDDRGKATFRADEIVLTSKTSSYDIDSYGNIWNWSDASPNTNTATFNWRQYYQMLFTDNYIIEKRNDIQKGTKKEIDQLVGEAFIMRAYTHFLLVNLYGPAYTSENPESAKGIPLKLNTISDEALKKNTVKEVYTSVLSDIYTAEGLINQASWKVTNSETNATDWTKSFGYRFNIASVNALRSRVYLYMGEWSKSLIASESALKSADEIGVALSDMRNTSLLPNNYKSIESIVAFEKVMTSQYARVGYISNSLLGLYQEGDLRKSLYFKGNATDGYKVAKGGNDEFRCSFRIGELYLNAAEAAAHVAGKDAVAKKHLLTLMEKRYSTAAYEVKKQMVNAMNNQDLITEIANERARELAFEGHRWFDLRRTTRPRIEKTFGDKTYVLEQNDPRYTIRIPAEAVASNPNLAN